MLQSAAGLKKTTQKSQLRVLFCGTCLTPSWLNTVTLCRDGFTCLTKREVGDCLQVSLSRSTPPPPLWSRTSGIYKKKRNRKTGQTGLILEQINKVPFSIVLFLLKERFKRFKTTQASHMCLGEDAGIISPVHSGLFDTFFCTFAWKTNKKK